MKPEDCTVGQSVYDPNDVLSTEGVVKELGFVLNDHDGLVPSARIQWANGDITWIEVWKLGIVPKDKPRNWAEKRYEEFNGD